MRGCCLGTLSMLLQLTTEQSAGRVGRKPCPSEEHAIVVAGTPNSNSRAVAIWLRWGRDGGNHTGFPDLALRSARLGASASASLAF